MGGRPEDTAAGVSGAWGERPWVLATLLLGCTASGGLLGAALVVPGWRGLAWLAMAPLAGLLSPRTPPGVTCAGAFLGATMFHMVGLYWLCLCIEGAFAFVWFYSTLAGALCFAGVFLLGRRLARATRWPAFLLLPVVWIACEYCRQGLFILGDGNGLPLLWLGLALVGDDRLVQVADLGGVHAATWLLASVNGALFDVLACAAAGTSIHRLRPVASAVLAIGSLAGAWAYGAFRLAEPLGESGPTVALVAASLSGPGDLAEQADFLARASFSNSPTAAAPPAPAAGIDLYAWPEMALEGHLLTRRAPGSGRVELLAGGSEATLHAAAGLLKAPLAMGTRRLEFTTEENWQTLYNSAVCFSPREGLLEVYDKRHSVPFVEFTPGWLRQLAAWKWVDLRVPFASERQCARGNAADLVVLKTPGGRRFRVALTICYDVCFPDVHREYCRGGLDAAPDLFLSLMDESFDGSNSFSGASLRHSRLRAVECRRPYFRVSLGGISAVIDSRGRVLRQAWNRSGVPTVLVGQAAGDRRVTIYARYGDWLPQGCMAVIAAIAAAGVGRAALRALRRCRTAAASRRMKCTST